MIKKVASVVVSLSMMISLIAGCATKKDEPKKQETPKAAATAAAKKEIPKIKIFQNSGKYQSAGKPGSNPADLEDVKKYIVEKCGVEPEMILPPKGGETEKLNILLASNEPLDLFWGWWPDFQAKGAIQPVNEALQKGGSDVKKAWTEDAWAGMTDKEGKVWGVPRMAPFTVYPVFVRTDWLQKVGMQMPQSTDELENVLKAFKEKDPAGNGQTIPFACDLVGLHNSLAAGFIDGGAGNWLDKDGKIKPLELAPGYKDFLKKMSEWYQKGYIYKETFTSNRDRLTELLKQNKIGSLGYWYSLTTLQSPYLKQNVPDANYEMAKGLKGPKGLSETSTGASASGALIPKSSKNADAVIKYINWAYQDIDNHLVADNGMKGKHWEYTDEKNHVIKILNENYIGEFVASQGLGTESKYSFSDPIKKMHYAYIAKDIQDFTRAKKTADWDVIYNTKILNEKVPTMGDLNRMRTEEVIKFIVGARPLDQYDQFVKDLQKAGLDKWVDAYTEQYNQLKKK